ncbi:hypothetical protein M5W75_14540 [Paenibacillus larvae]|nr:hypothetical protein [Paenibacillus larvae]MCY9751031.1 hypothetical protein [Paenibacillus larvae]
MELKTAEEAQVQFPLCDKDQYPNPGLLRISKESQIALDPDLRGAPTL